MAQQVRAAVIAGPHRVETRRFPYPDLEDGAMLMKMEMSGICGSDKHSYKRGELDVRRHAAERSSTPSSQATRTWVLSRS